MALIFFRSENVFKKDLGIPLQVGLYVTIFCEKQKDFHYNPQCKKKRCSFLTFLLNPPPTAQSRLLQLLPHKANAKLQNGLLSFLTVILFVGFSPTQISTFIFAFIKLFFSGKSKNK